jgi:hypothetical protein
MAVEIIHTLISSEISETAFEWIEMASIFVEGIAVIIILFGLVVGTFRFILLTFQKNRHLRNDSTSTNTAWPRPYYSAWRSWSRQM